MARIRQLEDLHSDQECYIFGDGTSIKHFDLAYFGDRPGIAVNAFPRHIDANLADIRYWIIAESGFLLPPLFRTEQNPIAKAGDRWKFQHFFRRQNRDKSDLVRLTSLVNCLGEINKRTYYFWDTLPRKRSRNQYFSRKESFAGSVSAALTFAAYLGFKRAYLVGFDYTHWPSASHHWYECAPPYYSNEPSNDYFSTFFEEIQQFIEVITITPSKQHTKLKSIDYETFTGHQLVYKENFELLSENDQLTLSLNPRLKIFPEGAQGSRVPT